MYIYKNKYHNCGKKIETLVERRTEEKRREKGTTEDEMAGWHYRLDGHESG